MKKSILFGIILGFSSLTFAKNFAVYKGRIINNGAAVYQGASFDAPVLTYVKAGKEYEISSRIFNQAFYRIKVGPKLVGYIADTDIQGLNLPKSRSRGGSKSASGSETAAGLKGDSVEKSGKRDRPYSLTQFVGPQFSYLNYREETMTQKPTEGLGFIGVKLSGPNIAVEGDLTTELNFLFHSGAPSYYEKGTRKSASGWVFLGNFLFSSVFPQSKNVMTFFGFGPNLKYSKFDVQLPVNGKTVSYSLEDITFGAAFNLGLGIRLGPMSLRGEIQYFWEQMQYYGLATSLQWRF